MENWDDFRFALAVAKHQSLKGASRTLGCDQATVGRRLYALEERLGFEIFEKRSDGFFLTLAGQRILEPLKSVEENFHGIERKLMGLDERPEGVVRIAMPGALANYDLIPKLKGFHNKYPDVELHFFTGAEVLNLAKREADLAVRLVKPKHSDLVYRRIGSMELNFYASKNFLASNKGHKKAEELKNLPFVGIYENASSQLELGLLEKLSFVPRYALRSSAWSSVAAALRADLGYGILPSFVAKQIPELQKMSLAESASTPLWLVVHPDIKNSARVRVVIEFLEKALS